MELKDIMSELINFKFTKYKVINLFVGTSALLTYEFIGRAIYRPYIYANNINDFHIADTLGNTLGTLTMIFFLIAFLTSDTVKGNYFIKLGTISLVLYEIAQPLLGKPIDLWDVLATFLTGFVSYALYNYIFRNYKNRKQTR